MKQQALSGIESNSGQRRPPSRKHPQLSIDYPDRLTLAIPEGERRRRILEVLAKHGPLRPFEIAGKTCLSPVFMTADLRALSLQDKVRQDGEGRWHCRDTIKGEAVAATAVSPDSRSTGEPPVVRTKEQA